MTVFLVNGVMLQGAVAGFDQFSLLLERGGQVQLVYKHAISTLQPAHPLDLEPASDRGRRTKRVSVFNRNDDSRRRPRRARGAGRARTRSGTARLRRSVEARLDEAQGLAEAIGIEVVARHSFRLRPIRPASLFGKGQVEEIAAARPQSRTPGCWSSMPR